MDYKLLAGKTRSACILPPVHYNDSLPSRFVAPVVSIFLEEVMPTFIKLLFALTIVGLLAFWVVRWLVVRASPLPENVGVVNGRLAPCPDSPNCVSTFATDEEHSIAPIPYEGETAVAQAAILSVLQAMPRFTIIANDPGYIHAEARSLTWHFIDDVEFYFDETAGLIHFRSASRLGYGDAGVNRTRMEEIRAAYQAAR